MDWIDKRDPADEFVSTRLKLNWNCTNLDSGNAEHGVLLIELVDRLASNSACGALAVAGIGEGQSRYHGQSNHGPGNNDVERSFHSGDEIYGSNEKGLGTAGNVEESGITEESKKRMG